MLLLIKLYYAILCRVAISKGRVDKASSLPEVINQGYSKYSGPTFFGADFAERKRKRSKTQYM